MQVLAKTRATHRQHWICLQKKTKTKQKSKQNKTKQKQTNKKLRIKGPTRTFPTTSKRFQIKITDIITNNSTKIFIFHLDKKKKKEKKKKKTKQNKNKNKKGPVPLTCGRLHYFSPYNNPPLSKWLRLKWQVAQSFHQACSHDLFWKGVGSPQKQWILDWKTFWTYLPRALGLTLLK